MHDKNVIMNWDRLSDVLYIRVESVDDRDIINTESSKYPGVIKRISDSTGECVGFIIHDFSSRFKGDSFRSEKEIKDLLVQSMQLSMEKKISAEDKACLPMSA